MPKLMLGQILGFAVLKPGSLAIRIATPILSLAMIVFGNFSWLGILRYRKKKEPTL